MHKLALILGSLILLTDPTQGQSNYLDYHKNIILAENLITKHKYDQALFEFEKVFKLYRFIFLREYQVACQLALLTGRKDKAFQYLESGISKGWTLKHIRQNKFLSELLAEPKWREIKSGLKSKTESHSQEINQSLRLIVHEMFRKDQRKAFGAIFRIGDKAQEKYGYKKFGPHSELQLAELDRILDTYGYPGEQLIGNDYWMSTIVSHHNSASKQYVMKDTIYQHLRPKLLNAIRKGELSPYEFTLMEDWKTAVEHNHNSTSFGFIGSIPTDALLNEVEQNRLAIGIRTIAIRNRLIDIEVETGMNFYLPGKPWQKGKILIPAAAPGPEQVKRED